MVGPRSMHSPRTRVEESVASMLRIAVLARMGLKQEEIAAHENTSVSTVARHLSRAREEGILGESLPLLHLPLPELDRVAATITDPRLTRCLQERLEPEGVARVRVIPAALGRAPESARRVAAFAGDLLAGDLGLAAQNSHVVGFTGGTMPRRIVDSCFPPAVDPELLTLVALGGEHLLAPNIPGSLHVLQSSANRLVADLALRLGVPERHVWRFGAPPRLPRALIRDERSLAAFRADLDADSTVRGILGARSRPLEKALPMIDRVDTVFTSVRALGRDGDPGEPAFLDLSAREVEDLVAAGVAGEWNGRLLAGSDADAECRRRVVAENRLATGASPADLKRVAERARPQYLRGRGVVVAASGPHVARALRALIAAGAVNEVVMASDTAVALLEELGQESAPAERKLG